MSEKEIMNSILEALELRYPGAFDRVNNIPSFDHIRKQFRSLSKYQRKGSSDITGCVSSRAIYIEVKTPITIKDVEKVIKKIDSGIELLASEKHLANQVKYLRDKEKNGGYCFFTCNVEHTINKIEELCKLSVLIQN